MAGEWRRASEAYGVSYGIHPFGMLAPVVQNAPASNPIPVSSDTAVVQNAPDAATTETTVDLDSTLTIQRWTARLVLHFTLRRRH
jgi:hypothetical protein